MAHRVIRGNAAIGRFRGQSGHRLRQRRHGKDGLVLVEATAVLPMHSITSSRMPEAMSGQQRPLLDAR
jgi:hypothetical protein